VELAEDLEQDAQQGLDGVAALEGLEAYRAVGG
jgi:hypothetical protein